MTDPRNYPDAIDSGGDKMIDLTPDEREALAKAIDGMNDLPLPDDAPVAWVILILAVLSAVPRLRETQGMGLRGEQWFVRGPDQSLVVFVSMTREAAEAYVEVLNRATPGHHAVRLAVVEVASVKSSGAAVA